MALIDLQYLAALFGLAPNGGVVGWTPCHVSTHGSSVECGCWGWWRSSINNGPKRAKTGPPPRGPIPTSWWERDRGVNQVWCSTSNLQPEAKGFLYHLVVVMELGEPRGAGVADCPTTLPPLLCRALEEVARAIWAARRRSSTDHRAGQFTPATTSFTGTLKRHGVMISNGRQGPLHDNIFVERCGHPQIQRSYLNAYATVAEAKDRRRACLQLLQ